jgi:hypothetical protein
MEAHKGLKKLESSLLTQLRTEKIGFNAFLYEMRVQEVLSPNCECASESMTVEHVLLKCPRWNAERAELIAPLRTSRITKILTTRAGGKAAVRLVQRTKLLSQFRAAAE